MYRDTRGFASIGVGRNLDAKGLHPDEIALLLQNDINEAIGELDRVVSWWRKLDAVRQKVMVDMMFNLGAGKLRQFSNTLAAIQDGRWKDASRHMLASRWAAQVGSRAARLARMMRTGEDYEK